MATKKRKRKNKRKTVESKQQPKQKAPMPEGVKFESGNQAACKYDDKYADLMMNYADSGYTILPSLEEFCKINNLPNRTVERWVAEAENKYPRLADSYARLKKEQKRVLIEKGLTERFNASMVKFLLSNNHDMSEKTAAEVNANTNNKFEVNIKVID